MKLLLYIQRGMQIKIAFTPRPPIKKLYGMNTLDNTGTVSASKCLCMLIKHLAYVQVENM